MPKRSWRQRVAELEQRIVELEREVAERDWSTMVPPRIEVELAALPEWHDYSVTYVNWDDGDEWNPHSYV